MSSTGAMARSAQDVTRGFYRQIWSAARKEWFFTLNAFVVQCVWRKLQLVTSCTMLAGINSFAKRITTYNNRILRVGWNILTSCTLICVYSINIMFIEVLEHVQTVFYTTVLCWAISCEIYYAATPCEWIKS